MNTAHTHGLNTSDRSISSLTHTDSLNVNSGATDVQNLGMRTLDTYTIG